MKKKVRQPCEMPATRKELASQLLECIASLDRGEGINGEEAYRQMRERIEKAKLKERTF